MPRSTLRFGPFVLDPIRRALTRDGLPVRLRPMAISLLCHLAQERNRVVPKHELLQTLWPDGKGSEANLTVTVAAVRKALGEISGQHRILITVPREGYRFVARLNEDGAGGTNELPRHLALLPIEIINGTQDEWGDVAEKALDAIQRHTRCLAGLEVELPRPEDIVSTQLGQVAMRLGTEAVLVGTLEQGSASVQLELKIVDRQDKERWRTRIVHPADELHTLPLRAARTVTITLNPDPGRPPRTVQPVRHDYSEAWRAFLQGRYQYASGDGLPGLHRAAYAFQQAIDLDPGLAPAHAGLAESLLLLRTSAMLEPVSTAKRIKEAAFEAFRHNPLLAESHMAMAQVCMVLEHDWRAGREHLMTALEFGPDNPWVHARYAVYLAWRRQFEAALDSIRRAHSLDPFSARITAEVAKIHYFADQPGVALSILESATSRKLDFSTGWLLTTWVHLGLGDGDAALASLEHVRQQLDATSLWEVFTGTAHGIAGRAELAHAALASLQAREERGESVPPQFVGMIKLSLGDFEGATECVRASAEQRYGEFPTIEADPLWAPLRSWPGYEPIRARYFAKRMTDA